MRPLRYALHAALLLPLLSGCQSGAQQDLVNRELRMQEDQLYAMEDYLEQYQQLVCKYRAENAALRRQLEEGTDGQELPAPRPPQRGRTRTGPSMQAPPSDDAQPPPELEPPDVPPLETSSRDGLRVDPRFGSGEVALAAGVSSADVPAEAAIASAPAPEAQSPQQVSLHGEVVESDGNGRHLLVDIQTLDAAGGLVTFDGTLSLMLLAPNGAGGQQNLARWDFGRKQVQSARGAAGGHTMRFHLKLPGGTPFVAPTQLWARLLPRGGSKLLTQVEVDLQRASQFASLVEIASPPEASYEPAAAHDESQAADRPAVAYDVVDAGWATARPESTEAFPNVNGATQSEWRASSEAPLVVNATASVQRPKSRPRPFAAQRDTAKVVDPPLRKPAAWSPERAAEKSGEARTAAAAPPRPIWSATR